MSKTPENGRESEPDFLDSELGEGSVSFVERETKSAITRRFQSSIENRLAFNSVHRIYDDPSLRQQKNEPLKLIQNDECTAGLFGGVL